MLDSSDAAEWESWVKEVGWHVIALAPDTHANIDTRVQAVERAAFDAIQNGSADPSQIYLAGRGESSAAVFYAISRVPDLWAAAVASGGSPQPAIDSGRLYAANFTNVPMLWIGAGPNDLTVAEKLRSMGVPLESRSAERAQISSILEWLGRHTRPEYPAAIDCETNSPTFARCYWIRMTKFDPGERNDVLDSTRVEPNKSASLDLGGFGFQTDAPGPGVLVSFLPEKYSGPLKMGDRIVALDGREITDGRRYVELMSQIIEERPAAVTVQRGKERMRVETRVVLPQRPASVTARVQAQYLPAEKEVQIVSRTVTEMRVTIPPQWVPSVLNWNGVALEKIETPGCRLLTIEKALQKVGSCP